MKRYWHNLKQIGVLFAEEPSLTGPCTTLFFVLSLIFFVGYLGMNNGPQASILLALISGLGTMIFLLLAITAIGTVSEWLELHNS